MDYIFCSVLSPPPPRKRHVFMGLGQTLALYKSKMHNIKSQPSDGISLGAELLQFGCLAFQWVCVFRKWVLSTALLFLSSISFLGFIFGRNVRAAG